MTKLIIPTVHLNGSSRDSLLEQATDAREALYKAIESLYAAAPNGRDYYVQESNAFRAACKQWSDRLDALRDVLKDLQAIALGIADQGK